MRKVASNWKAVLPKTILFLYLVEHVSSVGLFNRKMIRNNARQYVPIIPN